MTGPSPQNGSLEGRPSPGPGGDDGDGKLPAGVRDFAVKLGKAVQRSGLYPKDHPALDPIVGDVLEGLEPILSSGGRISLGVSRDRLVHEDGESDPDHPLLSSLARRLHDHHVARLTFRAGVERDELSEFLVRAGRAPESSEAALGYRREVVDRWAHVAVQPVRYDGLSMAEEAGPAEEPEAAPEGDAEELWLGLARSALAEEAVEELGEDDVPDLETVVSALDGVTADRARARTVAARMVALAQMLKHADEDDRLEVRERFAHLLRRLGPDTVGTILSAAPQEQRQAFFEAVADWIPAATAVELLEEVADSRSLDVSYQMLRLLAKLASYADVEADSLDPEAGAAFRDQVKRLITGWKANLLGDVDEEAYDRYLRRFSGPDVPVLPEERALVDPGRVVLTALEVDYLGPLGRGAVKEMLEDDRTLELVEALGEPPEDAGATEEIWELVDVPKVVRQILDREPPDFEAVDVLLERQRREMAEPLLDLLAESQSRSVRRRLFARLTALDADDVGPAIVERLDDDRWFVKRNMLALLAERGDAPDSFAPLPYTRHPHPKVRKEAYKLALRSDGDRPEALRRALTDDDRQVWRLALGALREMPDRAVDQLVPVLRRRLQSGDLPDELTREAARALGRSDDEEALEALLDLCRTRSLLRFWTVDLAEKSPAVLAGLDALARGWRHRSEARRVLARARKADDPEIRRAAREGSEAA